MENILEQIQHDEGKITEFKRLFQKERIESIVAFANDEKDVRNDKENLQICMEEATKFCAKGLSCRTF